MEDVDYLIGRMKVEPPDSQPEPDRNFDEKYAEEPPAKRTSIKQEFPPKLEYTPKREDNTTIHGNPILDGSGSSLYSFNSTPPLRVLTHYPIARLTDDEGRSYWWTDPVTEDFNWPKGAEIRSGTNFSPTRDLIFFVRPPKGKSARQVLPPEIDPLRSVLFYASEKGLPKGHATLFRGIVMDTGVDEIASRASGSISQNCRKSTYVVIRDLRRDEPHTIVRLAVTEED